MGCDWTGSGYWLGWPWINQIFWLLLFAGLGFLIFHTIRSGRSGSNSIDRYSIYSRFQDKCPNCGISAEREYLRCPECHFQLKINCPSCGKVVKTKWDICPYCEAELSTVLTK